MPLDEAMGDERTRGYRLIVGAGALVLVIAGLKAASAVFLPVLLGLFLTILSLPILDGLRRRRVPAVLAVLVTMLVVTGVLVVVGLVLSVSIQSVVEALPQYQDRARLALERVDVWLDERGVGLAAPITFEALDLSAVANLVGSTFRGVAQLLSSALLVFLTMAFMLWESVVLPAKLRRAERLSDLELGRSFQVVERVQRYLVLKTAISLATGLLIGLWVALLGLDFALFWGFVAFVLNYIPNFGSIIASIPAVALALVQLGSPGALGVALGYLAVNILVGNVVEPAVMGRGLRLSPLAIFLALMFWGWLWGALGAILSVPLTVSLKILFENTGELRWVAALLDRRPRDEPAA